MLMVAARNAPLEPKIKGVRNGALFYVRLFAMAS